MITAYFPPGVYLREVAEALYPAITVDYGLSIGFGRYWVLSLGGFSDAEKVSPGVLSWCKTSILIMR